MKTRNGFISNSSSTSFVLKNSDDIGKAIKLNMEIFKVSDIITMMKPFADMVEKIEKYKADFYNGEASVPYFLIQDFYFDVPYYKELEELEQRYPNCFITSPYDRDVASRENVEFEEFKGDI